MSSDGSFQPDVAVPLRLGAPFSAASPDAAVQLVAARYIRSPLDLGAIRDLKLVVFLLEVDGGHLARGLRSDAVGVAHNDHTAGRITALGGISRERVSAAITRLVEAGALLVEDGADPRLVFAERVLRPVGAAEHVDWLSVLTRLHGQTTALLLIQAVVEMMRVPWEWVSLPYEMLAERAYYSLGMVRHGMNQLLTARILERSSHSGRSHEYRCSSLGLHGGPRYAESEVVNVSRAVAGPKAASTRRMDSETSERTAPAPPAPMGSQAAMVVELGGLVLRLPEGTVISMGVDASGAPVYEIGPHLRIRG
jgi:hypothetical protein